MTSPFDSRGPSLPGARFEPGSTSQERGSRPNCPPTSGDLNALACFQWGVLTFRQERRSEAAAWFKKAVHRDEGNYWFHYYLAYAHDHPTGNPAVANSHYDAAVALKPRSPWVRFTRARYYRLGGKDWNLAVEELLRALSDFHALPASDRDPEFESQTRLELGLVRQSLGDLAGARAEYAAVVEANPLGDYAFAARLNRAKLDADAGDVGRARAEFDALLDAHPDDHTARLGRAMLALRVGQPERAETDLTALLNSRLDPSQRAESLGLRALARLELGRPSDAVEDADEAWRLGAGPSLERLRVRARIALGRVGGVELARPEDLDELPFNGPPLRADLRRLVEQTRRALAMEIVQSTAALEARVTLAVILSALGDRTAEAEADRVVAMAPASARVYLVRARIRNRAGRTEAAMQDVEQALRLEREDARAWEFRGRLHTRAGNPTKALADFDHALTLDYVGAAVHRDRAAALSALGDFLGAVKDWRLALARDPDDPRSFLGRAQALMSLGQWDQALADLEQAAAWADGRPRIGFQIAMAYLRCLPQRPQYLPRLTALLRRVWDDWNVRPRPGRDS